MKTLIILGKTFISAQKAADHFGVNVVTLRSRLLRGWTPEEAVGVTAHERKKRAGQAVVVNDISYSSVTEAANAYGLAPRTVIGRLSAGATLEEALGLVEHQGVSYRPHRPIDINGLHFPSLKDATEHYGLVYKTVNMRLARHWTLEEALELSPRRKSANKTV